MLVTILMMMLVVTALLMMMTVVLNGLLVVLRKLLALRLRAKWKKNRHLKYVSNREVRDKNWRIIVSTYFIFVVPTVTFHLAMQCSCFIWKWLVAHTQFDCSKLCMPNRSSRWSLATLKMESSVCKTSQPFHPLCGVSPSLGILVFCF